MAMEFIVLASGSSGNASFVGVDGFGLLIDFGLGPRQLETALARAGKQWTHVKAVMLTHTHGDHWNERTLAQMRDLRIPLVCHPDHQRTLKSSSSVFADLRTRDLIQSYELETIFQMDANLSCLPFPVRHDGGMTCGFRFEGLPDLFGQSPALGYAADLGSWDIQTVQKLANVDVLAVEFNHDVILQKASNRSRRTIARNLGHAGHLSNDQAAALVRAVLDASEPGRLQHVVQLHISESCNRPALVEGVMQHLVAQSAQHLQVHLTHARRTSPILSFGGRHDWLTARKRSNGRARADRRATPARFLQPFLPGCQE
jgi:phosphoribosyl 1,2-cyclic phosphodiesterase